MRKVLGRVKLGEKEILLNMEKSEGPSLAVAITGHIIGILLLLAGLFVAGWCIGVG